MSPADIFHSAEILVSPLPCALAARWERRRCSFIRPFIRTASGDLLCWCRTNCYRRSALHNLDILARTLSRSRRSRCQTALRHCWLDVVAARSTKAPLCVCVCKFAKTDTYQLHRHLRVSDDDTPNPCINNLLCAILRTPLWFCHLLITIVNLSRVGRCAEWINHQIKLQSGRCSMIAWNEVYCTTNGMTCTVL